MPDHQKVSDLPPAGCFPATRLAVIYAVRGSMAGIRKTLDCLHAQTAVDRIDLILTTDSPELLRQAEQYVLERGLLINPRFLRHEAAELASARVNAAKEASAEIITIAEDHSFPEANFAEELLAIFATSPAIVAASPVMHNPNPGTAVSRAQFLLTHGFLETAPSSQRCEEVTQLPWHNTTYRRAAFVAAARDEGLMQSEGLLQEEIRRNDSGARFVRCHRTSLSHVNTSLLAPAVQHAFHGGRIFGAERAKYHRWSWGARLPRVLLFPLVALLKMVRCAPILLKEGSLGSNSANLAIASLLALAHAMGEAVGIAGGKGLSAITYARYECDRASFLHPSERHLLFSELDFPQAVGPSATRPQRPTNGVTIGGGSSS